MYYFETHLHTSACSACGRSNAFEMVDAAKEKNYQGIILTNHFPSGNTAVDQTLPWANFFGAYEKDYEGARTYGESRGITVLFGLEKGLSGGKEALIYGIDPDVMKTEPRLLTMKLPELSAYVRKNGGWLVAAHPFRQRSYIVNPDEEPDVTLFDAIEGYNRCNAPEENEKAMQFAEKNHLPVTAGGDVHVAVQFGKSGLAFWEPIPDNKTLVAALQNRRYQLLIDGVPTDRT